MSPVNNTGYSEGCVAFTFSGEDPGPSSICPFKSPSPSGSGCRSKTTFLAIPEFDFGGDPDPDDFSNRTR
jgi:hypothetical protein